MSTKARSASLLRITSHEMHQFWLLFCAKKKESYRSLLSKIKAAYPSLFKILEKATKKEKIIDICKVIVEKPKEVLRYILNACQRVSQKIQRSRWYKAEMGRLRHALTMT